MPLKTKIVLKSTLSIPLILSWTITHSWYFKITKNTNSWTYFTPDTSYLFSCLDSGPFLMLPPLFIHSSQFGLMLAHTPPQQQCQPSQSGVIQINPNFTRWGRLKRVKLIPRACLSNYTVLQENIAPPLHTVGAYFMRLLNVAIIECEHVKTMPHAMVHVVLWDDMRFTNKLTPSMVLFLTVYL